MVLSLLVAVYIIIRTSFVIDGKTLSLINEDTQNAFEEYRQSFCAICKQLYELGLREHDKRMEEVRLFEDSVSEGKESAQNEARG